MKRKTKSQPAKPGIKSVTCPHCGKAAMTPAERFFLGFRVSVPCKFCKKKVAIPKIAIFYILIAGILAYGLRTLYETNFGGSLGFGGEVAIFVVLLLAAMLLDLRFGHLDAQT